MGEKEKYSADDKYQMEAFLVGVLKKCKEASLKIIDTRSLTFERVEMVVELKNLQKWKEIFAADFNGIRKDENIAPTSENLQITKAYGGLTEGQVLFQKDLERFTAIAMFWPWGDGQSMTVHMGFVFPNAEA